MKKILQLIYFIAFPIFILLPVSGESINSETEKSLNTSIVYQGTRKILHVSAVDAAHCINKFGKIEIINDENVIIHNEALEGLSNESFILIDISDFPRGNYTFIISTSEVIFSETFIN